MKGCSEHGHCIDEPLTCKCEIGWSGRFCDCPQCRNGTFEILYTKLIIFKGSIPLHFDVIENTL